MFPNRRLHRTAAFIAIAGLILLDMGSPAAQQPAAQPGGAAGNEIAGIPHSEPEVNALPLPEDRGQAALVRVLKELGTTASVMVIVAHPDDEDGPLMTYLSRGLGARVSSLTLTRGEGGQNVMSADEDDAMGLIRTNELLKADEYYGAKQLWGTEADFGFSKTQQEAFQQWTHERVLYDAVLAVRKERPQIVMSTFIGGITDGHGQHQVSGEIAQEVFKAAADPKVFPEQLKDGVEPWQVQAVYSHVPFARVSNGMMFDYATGKSAPARFHNYITGAWTTDPPSADVTVPVGTWDPVLGRTYVQIAREGWGEQKSQNGGANPALSGPAESSYHLWGVTAAATAPAGTKGENDDLFHNDKVRIDTSVAGLARLAGANPPAWLVDGLRQIDDGLKVLQPEWFTQDRIGFAHKLTPLYRCALDLYHQTSSSNLDAQAKASLLFELGAKVEEFQSALKDLLGLDLAAMAANGGGRMDSGSIASNAADEAGRSVYPGEVFQVRVHAAQANSETRLKAVFLKSASGSDWGIEEASGSIDAASAAAPVIDQTFRVQVPEDAKPTEPYFTRPSPAQPYYDIANPAWRLHSFAPYPLSAWAEFSFDNLPILLGEVVQTLQRVTGAGGVYEPLVVTPAIGVRVEPEARILPLDGSALPVRVTIHAQLAAEGAVQLKLPSGWRCEPEEETFHLKSAGDAEPLIFSVTPADGELRAYTIQAIARSGGRVYQTGWQSIGYPGLRPYNLYSPAELKTRKVDVKVAPGLKVAYVMGPGDHVPEAIKELGIVPHLLTGEELKSADLSAWNVIVIGIRAYSTRPELASVQPQLNEFVERGGTLVVQYQSETFPAPFPLAMGRTPERVVDERSEVEILDPSNPLLSWPNKITSADFDGWVEERGHSFLDTWDPRYTPLTETADAGQDPQRGGLLVVHAGKGTYIYVAYALYRQLPELVPGSYRILANLLSAGKE